MTRLFDVFEKQQELLVYNIILLSTRVGSILIGGLVGSDVLAIGLFGLSGALLALGQAVWTIRLSGWPVRSAVAVFVRFGLIALPFLAALWVIGLFQLGSAAVSIAAAVTVVLYLVIVHRRNPDLLALGRRSSPGAEF